MTVPRKTDKWTPTSRFTLVVTFEGGISDDELERIVDEARSYGKVERADFEVLAPTVRSMI